MDDVDAVQAQIARNMLESGDWVTARLNGVAYLEKSPLVYWLIALSYSVFGVYDWAGRLPIALSAIALCWLVARIGAWAFSARTGLYAGLITATCIGLWLFTRILIPDVILTLTVALALWSFLRALDEEEPRPRLWAAIMAASIGTGLLLKGLIAAVFPVASALLYLAFTKQLFERSTWQRLRPFSGALLALAIAAPWHSAATLANPPYFDFTPRSTPGEYHGFFWFYFLNEHVFRFLNMRHPRDYNTVPRALFWVFHLLWLFPWSMFLRRATPAAGRARSMVLLTFCWAGFILGFFTFSTTQEYYSMPAYPALALLLACGIERAPRWPWRVLSIVCAAAALTIGVIYAQVANLPAPGDISNALRTQDPNAYTLSLGHMGDLTLASFAYLRTPLLLAGLAFLIGTVAAWRAHVLGVAAMMVLFFHAARLALIAFDPYLGSHALAQALKATPPGQLIVGSQYYTFSSVFFYAPERTRGALLLNGRVNNLEYGSYAPGAPQVFLDDAGFRQRWASPERYYLLIEGPSRARFVGVLGKPIAESGGKFLYTNAEP
jgi:4-amino-4-deoxy-L-arabinose transferase-like glycosyltransferase